MSSVSNFQISPNGAWVLPGAVLDTSRIATASNVTLEMTNEEGDHTTAEFAFPGVGTRLHASGQIIAIQCGQVSWEGNTVSVVSQRQTRLSSAMMNVSSLTPGQMMFGSLPPPNVQTAEPQLEEEDAGTSLHYSFHAPKNSDVVHVRIARVTQMAAYGEIIAINGHWCCVNGQHTVDSSFIFKLSSSWSTLGASSFGADLMNSGSSSASFAAFKGIIRTEDVKALKGSKELEVIMKDCFRPGDVVLAEVVSSLTDTKQYQLSTKGPHFGVVYAKSSVGVQSNAGEPAILLPIIGVRDRMECSLTKQEESRWAPLWGV